MRLEVFVTTIRQDERTLHKSMRIRKNALPSPELLRRRLIQTTHSLHYDGKEKGSRYE